MIRQVEQFMQTWNMIPENRRILVGFSGGADSVALMEVLQELSETYGLQLLAVHVHHGIRETTADRDADFVENYCKSRQIPYRICHLSAVLEAAKGKMGLEEAGRKLRYRTFERLAKDWKAGAIAVAHHENDQAETMLFQIARGSGLSGAGGMRPVQGKIIRPLLCVERREIQDFLRHRGCTWCEDETNTDMVYTRNRIRQEILPVLETVNGGCVKHMASLAMDLQETESYLAQVEEKLWNEKARDCGAYVLLDGTLGTEAALLKKRLVRRAIIQLTGEKKDLTREHVEHAADLFTAPCGKESTLPRGMKAWRQQEGVCIGCQKTQNMEENIPLKVPGTTVIGEKMVVTSVKPANMVKITEKKCTKWVDYDKIETGLAVRMRRPGDRIGIDASGHHKKLKDFLIDRKVPKHIRDSLWIFADGAQVVWIPGLRLGADYKVTAETRQVLEIKITGECEDER